MFPTRLKITLALVGALGLAAEASAARADDKPRATATVARPKLLLDAKLLRQESVWQELKLTEKQLDKIQAIRGDIRANHTKELAEAAKAAKLRNPLPLMRLDWKMQAEENAALAKTLPDILKAGQMLRLRQISLQSLQRGSVRIFTASEVITALQLTEEQQKKIATIVKDTQEEMTKGVRRESSSGPIEVATLKKAVAAGVKKVRAEVLTEDQENTWKEMLGKPFDEKSKPAGGTTRSKD